MRQYFHHVAAPFELHDDIINQQFTQLALSWHRHIVIKKARYHMGNLQILTTIEMGLTTNKKSVQSYSFWWNAYQYADTANLIEFLLDNRITIIGRPEQLLEKLYA